MWMLKILLLTSIILCIYGLTFHQHKYELVQDDLLFDYEDPEILDVTGGISKFNATSNVVNVTINIKIALPDHTKFGVKAFKLINNQYRDSVIQFEKRLQDILEMEMFDLQSLWVTHARPPIAWPLEKGVTYTSIGWNPDSSKFPPNLPEGKHKVFVQVILPNKHKILVLYWFARVVYFKH